jgi:nitronate monooxygenase
MNELNIGGLKARLPIIQGGMGVCVSLSGLASAVANEGGIGVISAVGIGMTEPGYRKNFMKSNLIALRKQIRRAKALSMGIIGVNIMLAASDFEDLLKVSLEEQIDVVFIGAGLLLSKPPTIEKYNNSTKVVPKVSSARAAKLIFQHWSDKYQQVPDAIVVEGPLSGGHQGFKKNVLVNPEISLSHLSAIVKDTINEISRFEQKYGIAIPVIAAGGIYTGRDIYEIMSVGAGGVKMGTRFVTTTECDVSEKFKQNYIACKKEDITIIDSPVGLPARAITNDFIKQIQQGAQKPVKCPWKCLKTCDYTNVQFCIAEALFNAAKGNFEQGFSFAGSKAYLAKNIITVKETINQLKYEYLQEQERLEMIGK